MNDRSAVLRGQVALVTGGNSGIGRAICESLAAAGATVCFTGRRIAEAEETASMTGGIFFRCDNLLEDEIDACVAGIGGRFGPVTMLVNNAGNPGPGGKLESISAEDFDETIGVHLRGAFLMMKAVIPGMKAAGKGSIVNIGSVAAHRVGGHSPVYAAAKAGLLHLTRWAAMELGPSGIRVNSVSPGFIATEIHGRVRDGNNPADWMSYASSIAPVYRSMQALSRPGLPKDVADAVLYLAGADSAFVTGTDIVVDGGLSLGKRGLFPGGRASTLD